ncbi:MAG: phosphoglucomutase/phosphomannomutase family protein [Oscillospiraceae bacterium]
MIKFGTGGWREIIGDGFVKTNIQRIAAAMALKMKKEGVDDNGFVVGYDRRFLSRQAAEWICEVIAGEGIYCRLIDMEAPTPLVMFTVKYYNLDYGMAVTASHNPAAYNGIKLFTKGGRDADETVTSSLEEYVELVPDDIKTIPYQEAIKQGLVEEIDSQNVYLDSIIRSINTDAIRSRRLKIVLDPMFGVSTSSIQTVLMTMRCSVSVIHDQHDTLFGGRLPAPTEKTLADLRNCVMESKADIGIATDGDADRLGIIDETGRFIHPNQILVILYYYLIKFKGWHGAAVRNIATTHMLDRVAKKFGEKCYEVPVGFKYISSKMQEVNAVIGGESSGGLTVRGHIQGKDGIYAAALLVEMLAVTGKKLSEILNEIEEEFGSLIMLESDNKFSPERKQEIFKTVMEDKLIPDFGMEIERISYLDGCKIYFKNGGWLICRFSGTEPLLRIFCEMENRKDVYTATETMKEFLNL